MDFALFMERYGYRVLLWLMLMVNFAVLGGILFFWGYFTNGLAPVAATLYGGIMVVLKKVYMILVGQDPRKFEDAGDGNRRLGRRFFMGHHQF